MFEKGHKIRRPPKTAGETDARIGGNPLAHDKNHTSSVIPGGEAYRQTLDRAKHAKGTDFMRQYLFGGKILTRAQAIAAKCADCTAYYHDGRGDCENECCPLYRYMPYGKYSHVRTRRQLIKPETSCENL